jgi:hypothetical protein
MSTMRMKPDQVHAFASALGAAMNGVDQIDVMGIVTMMSVQTLLSVNLSPGFTREQALELHIRHIRELFEQLKDQVPA